jgi:hypothetical protein
LVGLLLLHIVLHLHLAHEGVLPHVIERRHIWRLVLFHIRVWHIVIVRLHHLNELRELVLELILKLLIHVVLHV